MWQTCQWVETRLPNATPIGTCGLASRGTIRYLWRAVLRTQHCEGVSVALSKRSRKRRREAEEGVQNRDNQRELPDRTDRLIARLA